MQKATLYFSSACSIIAVDLAISTKKLYLSSLKFCRVVWLYLADPLALVSRAECRASVPLPLWAS